MTDKLPPNLLALFTPRPPLRYIGPSDHATESRHTAEITGLAAYLPALQEYKKIDTYNPTESWLEKKQLARAAKLEAQKAALETYNASEDAKKRGYGDPFKTLFVSRLSYTVEVKDLEREFGRFGPIERIRLVTNTTASEDAPKKKRLRGYAFIVFERESDMKAAYKETDGLRIKDRRVLVDVERGRTVNGWRPRRLGGGLGGRGYTKSRPSGPGAFNGPPSGPGASRSASGFGSRPPRGFRGGGGGGGGGGFGDRSGYKSGGGGGGYGGRGGIGYQTNGHGSGIPPDGAPSGPRAPRRDGGHNRYEDRDSDRPRGSGSNREPVGSRSGGGYRDRDREGGYGRDDHRKRPHDGENYDDQRQKRRY